jgi:hypothetical protein
MNSDIFAHKVRTSTAIVALLLISGAGACLFSQSDAPQPPAQPPAPTTPTLSLGEPTRSVKLEPDDPAKIKYQNGFFFNFDVTGRILIRDKDGHVTGDLNLRATETSKHANVLDMEDAAVFKDGSIVASWMYRLTDDNSDMYFNLVHYDQAGNYLEEIDPGRWRAFRICIADDKSVWTLSGEEKSGYPVYSPGEGVLRNYKFGSGLVHAAVPRSTFPSDRYYNYMAGKVAIDCSGDRIHVLTADSQWIEYAPSADFTITKIEPFSHATFGAYWQMAGFACLHDGHAYAVIHSVPGDPFRRYLAELLPTKDGKSLQWVEVPDKTLPANNHPPAPTLAATPAAKTPPADTPKEPVEVTAVLGVDHEDGEQLVYRITANDSILFSRPSFAGPTPR